MRLESALFSSSTGMDAHGEALAVIGDNVSNANTVGFKAGNVQFSDLLAEGAEEHNSSAQEISGNGVVISQVRQDHSSGVVSATGRSLDVAIDGRGYLAVGDATNPAYTRAGSLIIDENGLLATSSGDNILGYTGSDTATLGTINMNSLDLSGSATTSLTQSGNLNSAEVATVVPEAPGSFNEIGEAASFVANLTAYDSLGEDNNVTVAFYKLAANSWIAQAYVDGSVVGQEGGIPVQVGANATITFDTNGRISDANAGAAIITATPAYVNGAAQGNFTMDFSALTQYAGTSLTANITNDGEGIGDIEEYLIDTDGSIYALLSSGNQALIGSVPVASFNNDEGLARTGNALFSETATSGNSALGTAGQSGFGAIQAGALELSNVDIANEFVDLVVFQRGYSANSRVFSTTGDMIRDTINLMG